MKELLTTSPGIWWITRMRCMSAEHTGDGETGLGWGRPEDMGKVIGRQGRIAKEIRTLIRSVAQRQGTRVSVEIID